MKRIRALVPVVLACCTAVASLSASAQGEPAVGKRQKVDVRTMVPGPQASDVVADARPAGGLTRDQRKEAALQARQDGTLRPAGEAADQREVGPAPLASAAEASSTPPVLPAGADGDGSPPTQVAAATSPPAKKSKSKKARPSPAPAPA